MATRTLERRRDRILTMMVVPLMSCSARLPVYSLIIASLFMDRPPLLGFLPADVVLMGCMYLFSTLTALLAASVLGRTLLRGPKVPLILELPPYRMPRLPAVLRQMWMRARMFVTEAGTVILACTAVLWVLLYFPRGAEPVIPDGASPEQVQQIEAAAASEAKLHSYGGQLGHFIEPTIRPLGFDWRLNVGLLGSFGARELMVGTLGVISGIEDADEHPGPLATRLRTAEDGHHHRRYSARTGVALLVFFVFACQCMSTLAAIRRETRSWRWVVFVTVYTYALAWVAAFVAGRLAGLLGLG
jgi:ferrous iron transport protein B